MNTNLNTRENKIITDFYEALLTLGKQMKTGNKSLPILDIP